MQASLISTIYQKFIITLSERLGLGEIFDFELTEVTITEHRVARNLKRRHSVIRNGLLLITARLALYAAQYTEGPRSTGLACCRKGSDLAPP